MRTAFIVSPLAHTIPKLDVDYIGMDMGAYRLLEAGLPISFILGDFDSGEFDANDFQGIEMYQYPIRKDQTDSELALKVCLEKGYESVILWDAISNRLDHTYLNIKLLEKADGKLVLKDRYQKVSLCNKGDTFFDNQYSHISFFPLEPSIITLKGFEYELEQQEVNENDLYLISNAVKEKGQLCVHQGKLLCIQSKHK